MKSGALIFSTLQSILCWFFCIANLTTLCLARNSNVKKYHYEQKKIQLPVDHFSFSNNDTFELRYLVNDTWRSGDNPPIFFYPGNEDNIEIFARNSGFLWKIVPRFGAVLIFAEHRYYGQSMPYGNKSFTEPKYLGYLTSQQALADYVDLIVFIKEDMHLKESPVIAISGFYGSAPSVWIRKKYPHIVHGAIASSILPEYLHGISQCQLLSTVATETFESVNSACTSLLKKSWQIMHDILSTDEGKEWFRKNLFLCEPINTKEDIRNLMRFLGQNYVVLAAFNYPYEADVFRPLAADPVWRFCSHLLNRNLDGEELLLALYRAVSTFANITGNMKCLDTFTLGMSSYQDNLGAHYQACTETFIVRCSRYDSIVSPLIMGFGPDNVVGDRCQRNFQFEFRGNQLRKIYGKRILHSSTNTIVSQAQRDPWSGTGKSVNFVGSHLTVIPDGLHHFDLQASHPKDPYSVVKARKFYVHTIKKWIARYHDGRKGKPLI